MDNSIAEGLKEAFDSEDLVYSIDVESIMCDPEAGTVARNVPEIATSAIQERLDCVFGIDGWETFVEPLTNIGEQTGFQCPLRAHFPGGKTITKTGVGVSSAGDANEAMKKAFHSAARLFGVGRYLDTLEEEWVSVTEEDLVDLGLEEFATAGSVPSEEVKTGLSQRELEEDIPFHLPSKDRQSEIPLQQTREPSSEDRSVAPLEAEESVPSENDRLMPFRDLPPSRPRPDYPH